MGTDGHFYVDYGLDGYARNFAKINVARDYYLFSLLSGARYHPSQLNQELLIEPRGLPNKVSWQVEDDNELFVSDEYDESGFVSRGSAEVWVENGSSKWVNEDKTKITNPDWHSHSYFYLDELKKIQEQYSGIEQKQREPIKNSDPIPDGYEVVDDLGDLKIISPVLPKKIGPNTDLAAIIGIMEALNKGKNPKYSRLIVWYDN